MIEMRGIEQFYGGTQILWDLSLSVGSGSCVSILGRNGVGKTTLLKSLMGVIPISAGKIILNGELLDGLLIIEGNFCQLTKNN